MVKQYSSKSATPAARKRSGGLVSSGYSSISFDVSPDPRHLRFSQAIERSGRGDGYNEIINTAQTTEGPSGCARTRSRRSKSRTKFWTRPRSHEPPKAFIYVSAATIQSAADSRCKALQDMPTRWRRRRRWSTMAGTRRAAILTSWPTRRRPEAGVQ
jgi:hypothetical protein